jgi:hypothetical protein
MIVGEAGGLVSFGTEVSAGFVMVKHGYLLPSGYDLRIHSDDAVV